MHSTSDSRVGRDGYESATGAILMAVRSIRVREDGAKVIKK